MIHPKISSPSYATLRKKRRTSSGKTLVESAKSIRHHERIILPEYEGPAPIRYADLYKREKDQIEMAYMSKKKKSHIIAPDTLIPNSTFRTTFKTKEMKPLEAKAFQLRLDILANLQIADLKKLNDKDDDEWSDLIDSDSISKSLIEKKPKGKIVSRQKDTMPDLFQRIYNESWWKQPKEEKPNVRTILLHLIELLKAKQRDSYLSVCSYIGEIFRTIGIESVMMSQILDILLNHLSTEQHDPLDLATIRTMAEFMIERKDMIVKLLEYTLTFATADKSRQEVINSIKFITDVNSSDDIDLVLVNMSLVHNAPDESFSLKRIIDAVEGRTRKDGLESNGNTDNNEIHPLLKKISEERWFPRGHFTITLDFVLDAIIEKLSTVSKTNLKTLTAHLAELNSVIGFSNEQFDRASNAVISVLSHNEADYRLIAATTLVNLKKETKAIDLALLNSFLNDSRVLVRTECCDSLKKLTGITSDTVLTDCANDISYLQTLPEDDFSLQNYLREKHRLATLLSTDRQNIEGQAHDDSIQTQDIQQTRSCSPSSQFVEPTSVKHDNSSLAGPNENNLLSVPSSFISSIAQMQTTIRVEISDKRNSDVSTIPRYRKDRTSSESNRQTPTSPSKTPIPEELRRQRSSLLPNNTNMWDSYAKQNETTQQKDEHESQSNVLPDVNGVINDPVQKLLDEHKRTAGFYRMSNRRILIPKKVSMSGVLCDQTHIIEDQNTPQLSSRQHHTMNLLDLKNNQYHLSEFEFVQLLSSLVVRALQVHRQYEMVLPGSLTGNFANSLNISSMPLHTTPKMYQLNADSSTKLSNVPHQRPTSRQLGQIQLNAQKKAAKEGINVSKAQSMEGALSSLLKTNRDKKKSITISSPLMPTLNSNQVDVTHAWLLIQLLKAQGAFNSENYLQKVIHTFPKFIPLLHTRIPQSLIPIIWNDPVIKQIASIFGNNQEPPIVESLPTNITQAQTKSPSSMTDYDGPPSPIHYPTFITRDDPKKKFLPPIRGTKLNAPHHVLKFGFREIEVTSPESPYQSSPDENRLIARRRRVYMHLMMSANDNSERRENVKARLRHMVKSYQTHTFMPIISRPPMF